VIVRVAVVEKLVDQTTRCLSVVEAYKSTVAFRTPLMYTYALPRVEAFRPTQPTERPLKVRLAVDPRVDELLALPPHQVDELVEVAHRPVESGALVPPPDLAPGAGARTERLEAFQAS
jgi:hypothetical protein